MGFAQRKWAQGKRAKLGNHPEAAGAAAGLEAVESAGASAIGKGLRVRPMRSRAAEAVPRGGRPSFRLDVRTDEPADESGDEFLVRCAHAFGVAPETLVRGVKWACSQVEALDDLVPDTVALALTTALGTRVSGVDLVAAGTPVSLTAQTGFSGIHVEGGALEFRAFRPGNSEGGELVTVEVIGRSTNPVKYQFSAGTETLVLPWDGPINQTTHQIRISSPQGDATNPVRVEVVGRMSSGAQSERVGRRGMPDLSAAVLASDAVKLQAQDFGSAIRSAERAQKAVQNTSQRVQAMRLPGS